MLQAKLKPATRRDIWLLAASLLLNSQAAMAVSEETERTPFIPHLTQNPSPEDTQYKTSSYISIAAVGDIMLGTDYPSNRLPAHDGKKYLAAMHGVLRQADITFGNLEGTLMDGGKPEKKCRDTNRCYLFRSPSRYAGLFRDAGFDVLSLANNHARDFGEDGRSASMQALDNVGIHHSGRDDDIASWTVKGVSVAMIAFAPFRNAHNLLDIPLAQQKVEKLSRTHDIVMVSMHAGGEGLDMTRLPFASEYYRGEDRGNVIEFARAVVEAGADIVLGHGPHVPRAIEIYQGRLIAYSLGNFATYYGISVANARGLAPVLLVRLDKQGRFVDGRIHSAIQTRAKGTQPDPDNKAAKLIQKLTRLDFPETALQISEAGRLFIHESLAQAQESAAIGAARGP